MYVSGCMCMRVYVQVFVCVTARGNFYLAGVKGLP